MTDVFIDPVIANLRALYSQAIEQYPPTLVIRTLLEQHAAAIHQAFDNGNSAVSFHLGSWCPQVRGKKPDEIMATLLNLKDIKESVALEYGFADWETVQQLNGKELCAEFETAVENVITGKLEKLEQQLIALPSLVTQRSGYGHQSTLLHYVGANGVESQRQISPINCSDITQCLIDHGCEVNAEANMYGGSTTLGLVLSSAHPAKAGVTESVATVLRKAGGI